jgi:hypothetical protein
MLNSKYANVFSGTNPATSVTLVPVVSAEWNQNLFNQPYITVAGNGAAENVGDPQAENIDDNRNATSTDVSTVSTTNSNVYVGIETKTFSINTNQSILSYNFSTTNSSPAYKIITYIQTDSDLPVQANAYASGTSTQYGSSTVDVNAFGYVKLVTYIGGSNYTDGVGEINYSISFNSYGSNDISSPINIYYTTPQVYETTFFDYQYGSLWPTESPFGFFRPGESYVPSGNSLFSFPSNYREITTNIINGKSGFYSPVTSVIQNPGFTLATAPSPLYKHVFPSDMSTYKYFVSDSATNLSNYSNPQLPQITAIYEPKVNANKIVLKFNTLQTIPNITVKIDGTSIWTGDVKSSVTNQSESDQGVVTLYYNGSSWSTSKWSTMPHFSSSGTITPLLNFGKITVIQNSKTTKSDFTDYENGSVYVSQDLTAMHLVEISPRIEVDISQYVMQLDITKSLDSKNNYIPISSINPNQADLTISAIPLTVNDSPVPIFSSQNQSSVLYNMMKKNIKFYFGWNLQNYFQNGESYPNDYIPAGIYWAGVWDETDIQTVKVTCYDIVNYMQTIPAPDYVASNKNIFDIITNLLDLAGYTDYDYDSLYSVTQDSYTPMDMYYFYTNSQAGTIYDALSELFLAHQIGAYIDEYGVMRFLSLTNIMRYQPITTTFNDSSVIQGGYSITNKTKPGSITVSYQEPRVTQSLALQNATNPLVQNSPSFIYTTSNEVVWSQKDADSVGSNYLYKSMMQEDNYFQMNNNSLLDIFHTYLLNNDGYAVIENEIVSFLYKEYLLQQTTDPTVKQKVYPKTDLELSAAINDFIKQNQIGFVPSSFAITNAVASGTSITYTIDTNGYNTFQVGMNVFVSEVLPKQFNVYGYITAVTENSFTIKSSLANTYTYASGGLATASLGDNSYDITVTPTGKIANVQRGMFGTYASDHLILQSDISEKFLTADGCSTAIVNESLSIQDNPSVAKIAITPNSGDAYIYNSSVANPGFNTYSCKFDLNGINLSKGGVFFKSEDITYTVNLLQINSFTLQYEGSSLVSTWASPQKYNYYITINKIENGSESILAVCEANGIAFDVQSRWEKVLTKLKPTTANPQGYGYSYGKDQEYALKVVLTTSDGTDGEISGQLIDVYLNNIMITGWQIPDDSGNNSIIDDDGNVTILKWKSSGVNSVTGIVQKVNISSDPLSFSGQGNFGFVTSITPMIPGTFPNPASVQESAISASLREIYACEKPLIERSVSYYYQDREFLNGMIQGNRLFNQYKSYMMQTNPEVTGINYYDVQYQTPAATSVDVLPIEYLWYYFPGTQPVDQQYYQSQMVDEYSLSYSTPINTGFRARMAIVNNVGHMVYLTHASDSINQFTVSLNLWTHEIVAPSDAQTLQRVIDPANQTEVIQVDSPWIQSKQTANRIIDVIAIGNDGFSRDTQLQVFGNPLIQVGDIINLTYSLAGINNAKYLVHQVENVFDKGLKTTLTLNSLNKAVNPTNQ